MSSEKPPSYFEKQWLQQWAEHREMRRAFGVFYTPKPLAERLVEFSAEFLDAPPERVLEPTCGSGVFVEAVQSYGQSHWGWSKAQAKRSVMGVELDPVAAWIAERRTGASIHCGSILETVETVDQRGPFDLIIGNPPFGGAIRGDTARSDAERAYYRKRFPVAASGAYDRSALFVERGLELLSDRGVLAFVLPRQVLSSSAAESLRYLLAKRGAPGIAVIEQSDLFDQADIHVCGLVVGGDRKRVSARIRWDIRAAPSSVDTPPFSPELPSWSPLLTGTSGLVVASGEFPTLGSIVTISASATTHEAYVWKPHIQDLKGDTARGSASVVPMVVSGMMDPFRCFWGERKTRYLKDDYQKPVVPRSVLSERRQAQASSPKVLVVGLSQSLEAYVDIKGEKVGAVATFTITPPAPADAYPLQMYRRMAAIIQSAWSRLHYRVLYEGSALSGGNIAVSRSKLEQMPVIPAWVDWLFSSDDDELCDRTETKKEARRLAASVVTGEEDESLYKRVVSVSELEQLLQAGRDLRAESGEENCRRVLDEMLKRAPEEAISTGIMDVLLFSLVQEGTELITPEV